MFLLLVCYTKVMDKYLHKIEKTDTCWNWLAEQTGSGYGRVVLQYKPKRKTVAAHRVIYELLVGKIPEGLQLDHLCRNRRCVNPKHLEPVTGAENVRRGYESRGRPYCIRGHLYTEGSYKVRNHKWKISRTCLACCNIRVGAYLKEKRRLNRLNNLAH